MFHNTVCAVFTRHCYPPQLWIREGTSTWGSLTYKKPFTPHTHPSSQPAVRIPGNFHQFLYTSTYVRFLDVSRVYFCVLPFQALCLIYLANLQFSRDFPSRICPYTALFMQCTAWQCISLVSYVNFPSGRCKQTICLCFATLRSKFKKKICTVA